MASIDEVLATLRKTFASGRTKSIDYREQQLKNFLRLYEENVPAMLEALQTDLRKSKQESMTAEIVFGESDLKHTLENLREWAKPEKPPKGVLNILDEVMIVKDPYGVVLVIGTWNYPIHLILVPVVAAIAAGNCVVIKPSEVAPTCAKLVADLIPQYLDSDCYRVVLGGPKETTDLLEHRFDYIFFTGSTKIGKIVHAAANKYLTPTTLELGGKSPVILDKSADIEVATRRILWGKCVNAGQTCVAPDYIICKRDVGERFVGATKSIVKEWYGDDLQQSPDFGRIINDSHFQRLSKMLENKNIVLGGKSDQSDLFIPLTILVDVKPTDEVMQEEIFGPILPVMYVDDVNQAIEYINANEKPLSIYIFSKDRIVTDQVLNGTSCGGVCVNDTMLHIAVDTLPFGGVGNSGMGSYHGKYSFDTFVHKKSVLIKDLGKIGENLSKARYPPYSDAKLRSLSWILGIRFPSFLKLIPHALVFALGAASAITGKCLTSYYENSK